MNTEREALINQATAAFKKEYEGSLSVLEPVYLDIWVKAWLALANKPEAEPVASSEEKVFQYCVDADMTSTEADDFAYKLDWRTLFKQGLPPSTADLQKRIEELEAAIPAEVINMFEHGVRAFRHKIDGDVRYILNFESKEQASEESAEWEDVLIFPNISNKSIDAIRALKAGDVQAPKEGWISVEDRLPPLDTLSKEFNVVTKYGEVTSTTFDVFNMGTEKAFGIFNGPPITHWQPLPAAPTDTEGK